MVCSAGYFGKFCDLKCPPGTFGLQCSEICKCTKANCDHIKGCQLSTKSSTYVTKAGTPITFQGENRGLLYTSQTFPEFAEKMTLSIPEQYGPRGKTNANYLVVGVGGVTCISIVLFILVMQLYRKQKSSIRGSANLRIVNGNDTRDESRNKTQNWHRKRSYQIPEENKSSRCYDHINTEYQEIDEFSEKKNESTFLNASGCFEIESNFCSTCPSINNVSRLPSNTSCGQQLPINKCSEIDHSDAYLQPLSGYEKQHARNADEIQSCDDGLE